jgi:hypothetical protein
MILSAKEMFLISIFVASPYSPMIQNPAAISDENVGEINYKFSYK